MTALPLKILYVHHGSGMGGAPQLLLTLIRALDRSRFDPLVWCIRRSSASAYFESHGIPVIYESNVTPFLHISDGFYGFAHPHRVAFMLAGQWRSYRTARRLFDHVSPDLIHINSVVLPGVLLAAARTRRPVVLNVLECVHPGYLGLRRALLQLLSKRCADAFIFMLPSEARRWHLEHHPRAVCLFDFISPPPSTPPKSSLRREFHVADNIPLIAYFGRFTQAKGVHLLLHALGLLRARGIPFHCLLVGPLPPQSPPSFSSHIARLLGRRPYLALLRQLIAQFQLHNYVTFTGERTDVADLVPQCDILVVPFTEPHFSRLCGEAALAARPVVAFNIDGPGEEIIDGVTGLLAKPFSPTDLADKLEILLTHPALRHQLGAAARQHAANFFDADRNVRAVLSLYSTLLPTPPLSHPHPRSTFSLHS
ncbi:MAG: glycosyltransferase [bacterium]|nr:glycosyltransferase [bacterium]